MLPAVAGMTGMHYHAQLPSIEMGSHKLSCLGWPRTVILLISASHVAGMTEEHHAAQLLFEIGSHKLFALAGLKLQSSLSQLPK
jgi:hypothetical protein